MFPTIGADFTVPLVLQSTADAPLADFISVSNLVQSHQWVQFHVVTVADAKMRTELKRLKVESETPPELGSITTICGQAISRRFH